MQVHVSPAVNALIDEATALSVQRAQRYVNVDLLYEALLRHPEQLPACVNADWVKAMNMVLQEVQRTGWKGALPQAGPDLFFTPRCAEVLNQAARLAQRFGNGSPDGRHLLLALLEDPLAAPSRCMDRLGVARQALVESIRSELHAAGRSPGKSRPKPQVAEPEATPREGPRPEPREETPPPGLDTLTRDLTAMARLGTLEKAVGRNREMFHLLEVLTRKSKNNVILVGDAGTGKTRIVEGLAVLLSNDKTDGILDHFRILELNLAALTSGTQYRGQFEEKILALLDEIKRAGDVILFIDEIHLIMGAGATDGSGVDLANLLKPALARGDIHCIGATTMQEYRKFIERDPAIERRFQMVRIEELSREATLEVLKKLKPSLEKHHRVHISSRSLTAAIDLTDRYMPNRRLPDKAIDVLDQACARYRLKAVAMRHRKGGGEAHDGTVVTEKVTPHDVRKVVSRAVAVPIEEITAADRQRMEDLGPRLRARVIGQDHAVEKVVAAVKRSRAGLADPNRPDSVMLFLGPSGVGKTELAKALARLVFGSRQHLVTFDMSEYVEEHSVSRLLGAPPGYQGSDQEGRLTGAVRNAPFSVLLFDEIEKAHPRVFDVFLPLLDEGRLKDSQGREASFRNTMVIFTSNIGAERFLSPGDDPNLMMEALRGHFRPEFINRIDEIIPFYPLLFEDLRAILKILFREVNERLREQGVRLRVYQGAYEHLATVGYSREYGARELRRTVERLVTNPLSAMVIENSFSRGDIAEVLMEDGQLVIRRASGEVQP